MKNIVKLKEFCFKLNYMEFGYLYASIKEDAWDKMPRSLWLKLKIGFIGAYVEHDKLGKRAKEDADRYIKELKQIERSEDEKPK